MNPAQLFPFHPSKQKAAHNKTQNKCTHISICLRGSLPAFFIVFYIPLETGLRPYKRVICLCLLSLKKKKKIPLDCPETGKIIQINFPFCLFVQFKMIKFTSHFKTLQGHFASSESSSTWTTLCLSNV